MIKFIKKRDERIDRFDVERVKRALSKAANAAGYGDNIIEIIACSVIEKINKKFSSQTPSINDIENTIIETANEKGYQNISRGYKDYRDKRAEARKILAIATSTMGKDSTDKALLIESDSKEVIGSWDRNKIAKQLEDEANLSLELSKDISKIVENIVVDMYLRGVRKLSTTDIRAIVDLVLRQEGLETQRKRQALLGVPSADFETILFSRSLENSNVASNNPEALNLELAERIQKQYALDNLFSQEVAEAHLKGKIHIHDLGYPARAYCSSHSLEYLKKFGLNKILTNLESKSSSPNSAAVLNQHIQTFLASLQAHYAGALGFGFLNIFYSSLIKRPVAVLKVKIEGKEYEFEKRDFEKMLHQNIFDNYEIIEEKMKLRELPEKEVKQIAQNLIFAASQNAFSRGGQTLFIDFNVHTSVPDYMKEVPAIGPKGKYMILMPDETVELVSEVPRFNNPEDLNDARNGDADSSQLEAGKIITYGDLEETSRKFTRALLEVWKEGDKYGRPFHFPKCDLHIEENSFTDEKQKELLDYAFEVSAHNGSVYFMFDRGNSAVLAQCCRLKEKITDKRMLKYPERLRFCGFQNVTINLAQASFRGQDLQGTFKEIDVAMELALKAHLQKAEFMKKLLETKGSPMYNLGQPSDDGEPYIDLKKSTYIVGVIGLNEAVQVLSGKQLHESESSYNLGLEIVAHMYRRIQEFKSRTGLKFTLEETPAESTTRRFAKVDLKLFEQAKSIIKGKDSPYYTNSIHFAPDAEVGLVERIIGQSKFHDMIESGAIIHAYIGEKRPDKEAIRHIVKKTLLNTRCAQLVFSPTYTECDVCGNVMPGDKNFCNNSSCLNSQPETIDKKTLFTVTRIVGYYSRIAHWNSSQIQIYSDRKKAEDYYAGLKTQDMAWLYNPSITGEKIKITEFARTDCPNCKILSEQVAKKIKDIDNTEFEVIYLDKANEQELAESAKYCVPLDSVPTLVIASKDNYWMKSTVYASECSSGVCGVSAGKKNIFIMPDEIELEIKKSLESNVK